MGELTPEIILRYEQVVEEWWQSLPPSLRMCPEPFTKNPKQVVDAATSDRQVLLFACLHAAVMAIHACLLRPRPSAAAESSLFAALRQRMLSLSVGSCESLVYAVKRLIQNDLMFQCEFVSVLAGMTCSEKELRVFISCCRVFNANYELYRPRIIIIIIVFGRNAYCTTCSGSVS